MGADILLFTPVRIFTVVFEMEIVFREACFLGNLKVWLKNFWSYDTKYFFLHLSVIFRPSRGKCTCEVFL